MRALRRRNQALAPILTITLAYLLCALALGLMLVITEVIFLASGVTVQMMLGFHDIEPGLYLTMLFGFQLTGYLLFAADLLHRCREMTCVRAVRQILQPAR